MVGTLMLTGGFSCGGGKPPAERLPTAGSQRDDGSGVLYELSTNPRRNGASAASGGNRYGGYSYGGKGYGRYSSARYANYQFDVDYSSSEPSPSPYESGYAVVEVKNGGTISGQVTWGKVPKVATTLPATAPGCDGGVQNRSLTVASGGRAPGVVVYLRDIKKGRGVPQNPQYGSARMQVGGVLVRSGCQFRPYAQVVVPIGGLLTVHNGDAGDHPMQLRRVGDDSAQPIDLPLSERGAEAEVALQEPGIYLLDSTRAGDPAVAWVVAGGHPYYTVTDADGRYRFDQVPPGSYTVEAWHPDVVTGMDPQGKRTLRAIPKTKRRVQVRARGRTSVNFRLMP